MLVYRLELDVVIGDDIVGVGPFCAEVWQPEIRRVTDRYKDRLGWVNEPQEDGIKYSIGEEIRCGVIDQFQVDKWFIGGWVLRNLLDAGFRIREYEVALADLRIGRTQVVWGADKGVLIRDVSFEELEELLPVYHDLPKPGDSVPKMSPGVFSVSKDRTSYSKRVLDRIRYTKR